MKKILSILLAMAILMTFATVFAAASPVVVEDPVREQGEALFEETMAIARTRDFTVQGRSWDGSTPMTMTVYDGHLAMEFGLDFWEMGMRRVPSWLFHALLGRSVRLVIDAETSRLVFPDRRFFLDFDLFWPEEMAMIRMLINADNDLDNMISLRDVQQWDEFIAVLVNIFDVGWVEFLYFNDELVHVPGFITNIDSLEPGADRSIFSDRWMLRLPAWLSGPFGGFFGF